MPKPNARSKPNNKPQAAVNASQVAFYALGVRLTQCRVLLRENCPTDGLPLPADAALIQHSLRLLREAANAACTIVQASTTLQDICVGSIEECVSLWQQCCNRGHHDESAITHFEHRIQENFDRLQEAIVQRRYKLEITQPKPFH